MQNVIMLIALMLCTIVLSAQRNGNQHDHIQHISQDATLNTSTLNAECHVLVDMLNVIVLLL
jgi:hypothetical protein